MFLEWKWNGKLRSTHRPGESSGRAQRSATMGNFILREEPGTKEIGDHF